MSYVVITTDGELHRRDQHATAEAVNAEVGEPGWAMVRLHPEFGMRAWVNDVGLLPPALPRNPVGACVIATMGAGMQPYAGPIVITGWHKYVEVNNLDLNDDQVERVKDAHKHVRRALIDPDAADCCYGLGWADRVREYAAYVRDGEPHTVQVLTGKDALERLRRGAS